MPSYCMYIRRDRSQELQTACVFDAAEIKKRVKSKRDKSGNWIPLKPAKTIGTPQFGCDMLDDQPDVNVFAGKAPGRFSGTDRMSPALRDSTQSDEEGDLPPDMDNSDDDDEEEHHLASFGYPDHIWSFAVNSAPFGIPDHLRVAVPSKATSVSATEIIDLEDPPVFEFRKSRTPRVVDASHAVVSASADNTCLKSCAAVAAGCRSCGCCRENRMNSGSQAISGSKGSIKPAKCVCSVFKTTSKRMRPMITLS